MIQPWCFSFTATGEKFLVPFKGIYRIECWGAQGGGRQHSEIKQAGIGGRGGYASGLIALDKGDELFVFVGGEGKASNSSLAEGGFNGGGSAYAQSSDDPGSGGGGASDVRLEGGAWDTSSGLLSRIIVGGGGGGGSEDANETAGYGGGLTGGNSTCHQKPECFLNSFGGSFGKGANTKSQSGGGGGWIGGNTIYGSTIIPTSSIVVDSNGGDGGSGYAYTDGVETYSGYLVPEKFKMFNTSLIPDQREGDGFVRITLISMKKPFFCSCQKSNGTFITTFFFLSTVDLILFHGK